MLTSNNQNFNYPRPKTTKTSALLFVGHVAIDTRVGTVHYLIRPYSTAALSTINWMQICGNGNVPCTKVHKQCSL